jgi:predicted DNA-binding transcriptional regulator AlpA
VTGELNTLPQIARRLGVAASTARGWRRYANFPAPAQTVADRHLYDVAEVDAWYAQHDPTPGKRASGAT